MSRAETTASPRRATEETIKVLQDQIRAGQFRPGEQLPSERTLSATLGVSRPTVREAVQALSAMNVVEVRRGSGIYVTSLDFDVLLEPVEFALELSKPTVRSLFEVRLALEPLAAELAAKHATGEQLVALQDCLRRMSKPRTSRRQLVELDLELHTLIYDAAPNELLRNIARSLSILGRKSRDLTVHHRGALHSAVAEHHAIVEAIATRQPKQARRAMADHLRAVWLALESSRSL